MSYDIWVEDRCEHCGRNGESRESINVTHNLNGIVDQLLTLAFGAEGKTRSWSRLEGMDADLVVPILDSAIRGLRRDSARFRSLEPANGWGDVVHVMDALHELKRWCELCPRGRIRTDA